MEEIAKIWYQELLFVFAVYLNLLSVVFKNKVTDTTVNPCPHFPHHNLHMEAQLFDSPLCLYWRLCIPFVPINSMRIDIHTYM